MQARILDFKKPLEVNLTKAKNKDLKNNDFSKKLSSANENNKSVKKQTNKDKENIKSNQESDSKLIDGEKHEKNEKQIIEEPKKDDEILYENMVNLLNVEKTEENPIAKIKESDGRIEFIETNFIDKENVDSDDKVLLLEKTHQRFKHEENEVISQKTSENNLEKIKSENLTETDEKEIKFEFMADNSNKKEISSEVNELEETSIEGEENLLEVKENFNAETKDESKEKNQKNETNTNKNYEILETFPKEESVEVKNDSFGPIIKNGLEFSTENLIESEVQQVEPKEVVKQIVDQVKFDLAENKNEIKLSLKPEVLGEMTMNIELAKDGIVARIMVDNYKTKEVIESNVFLLKEGIKDTGMEIKTFEVFVGNGSDFDQHESNQFNFNQNNKKLKIKNQKNDNTKFIEGYEEGTVIKNNKLEGNNLEGSLNLFA